MTAVVERVKANSEAAVQLVTETASHEQTRVALAASTATIQELNDHMANLTLQLKAATGA